MDKKTPVFIFLIITFGLLFSGWANQIPSTQTNNNEQPQQDINSQQKPDEREEILEALKTSDFVDVIVWLKDNEFTSPEYQDNLDKKRAEISKMQNDVLSRLSEDEFKLKQRYSVTNGFFGSVSEIGFGKLLADLNVEEIYLDKEVFIRTFG